jgi:hypothetical protein
MRKKLRANEGLPMMGTICMVVRDAKTRRQLKRIEIRNKITYLAADVLVELIAQRASDPLPGRDLIYSMRMGSSNTAAQRSDTNLGAFTIGKVIGDVGKINGAPGEITFIATLAAGDANGTTLREAGLFTAGTTPGTSNLPGTAPGTTRMFARQVYPDIPKTIAIVVDYSWTIAFTVVP